MSHFDELSEKLQKLIPLKKVGKAELGNDLTVSTGHGGLYFLTNIFKDGCLLGFWSHSPWGHTRDQEQGWVIISPELEVIEECETKSMGMPAGNDFMEWRKEQTAKHGKSHKLMAEFGEQFWKITEC